MILRFVETLSQLIIFWYIFGSEQGWGFLALDYAFTWRPFTLE